MKKQIYLIIVFVGLMIHSNFVNADTLYTSETCINNTANDGQ